MSILDTMPRDGQGWLLLPSDTLERFWAKVDKGSPNECWEWLGATVSKQGHGCFRLRRHTLLAHRISYLIHCGPIPEGMWVLHSCDNAPCINPAHLTLGTRAENIRAMWARGRGNWSYADGTSGQPRLHSDVRPRSKIARLTPLERMMARVTKPDGESGCWLWTGHTNVKGYGSIKISGRQIHTHRAAYALFVGPIPDGLWVLHHCDVPACVNPDHLWLGTNADNVADKVRKGRTFRATRDPETYERWYASLLKNRASGARHGRHTKPERTARGTDISCAKIDDDVVREIRRISAEGISCIAIAQHFGLRAALVHRVLRGETWAHVVG